MSARSPLEEHTAAVKANTTAISVAATAHVIQQERLIRAQKEQNQLIREQQEWERRKAEAEEDRRSKVANVRRFALELEERIARLSPSIPESGSVVPSLLNAIALLGHLHRSQIEENESALQDMDDIELVARVKKKMGDLDMRISARGFTTKGLTDKAEGFFAELAGTLAEIDQITALGAHQFSIRYLGTQPSEVDTAIANALSRVKLLSDASAAQFLEQRKGKPQLSRQSLESEQVRALGSIKRLDELYGIAVQTVETGLTAGYLSFASDRFLVVEDLTPIAYAQYAGLNSKLTEQMPTWRNREGSREAYEAAVSHAAQHYVECRDRVGQFASGALGAVGSKDFARAKQLLAEADTIAPEVVFSDLPELNQARSAYRWGIAKRIGVRVLMFLLVPAALLLVAGAFFAQREKPQTVTEAVVAERSATESKALAVPPPQTQTVSQSPSLAGFDLPMQKVGDAPLVGRFALDEPGRSGEIVISALGDGVLAVSIAGSTDAGCVAELENGRGYPNGKGGLKVSQATADGQGRCVIDIQVTPGRADVSENGCGEWHGMACGFGGRYQRQKAE